MPAYNSRPFSTRPILLVDDSIDARFLLRNRLARAHVLNPVVECCDGREAVARLASHWSDLQPQARPCLLILDLHMPEMSGFDVLAWLEAQPDRHGLKVVVISDSADPKDLDRAKASGADGCLTKFPSAEDLAAIVRSASLADLSPYRAAANPPDSSLANGADSN